MAGRSQDFSQQFWFILSYALAELCVIILLHVVAVASYAATWLARISRLRAPCTMCSRMDHALHGNAWFSADLVCPAHRSDISSLAFCTKHNNLARSDDLCKRCLLALGVSDEVNSRTRSRSRRLCSCCSEPFKKAPNVQKFFETANVVESSHGSKEVNRIIKVTARDCSNIRMPTKIVPEHAGPADHPSEKTFVVGIEEVREPDGASESAWTSKLAPSVSSQPSRIFLDRNGSIKNAFISRVTLPSPRPSEIISAMDNNSTTQQEVKALLCQMSSLRGIESSCSDGSTSPGINVQIDESNGTGRIPTLERSYSVLEPSDTNLAAGEFEGEISIESLKRQIELNKKSMSALYKELDEERSASAIAASQAMAMINRLHEEKAAMQMEALQYLRMMEGQADHDHEAIQNLHDLFTEREKELLDMDAELDYCRRLLQQESFDGKKLDATGTSGDEMNVSLNVSNDSDFAMSTMSGFEDEKAYIMESLKKLEEKICNSTNRIASIDAQNNDQDISGDHTVDESDSVHQSVVENHKDEVSCSTFDDDKMSTITSLG